MKKTKNKTFHKQKNAINYPLTNPQKDFWYIASSKKFKYNPSIFSAVYRYTGKIDIERLRQSILLSTTVVSPNVCSILGKGLTGIEGKILTEEKIELQYVQEMHNNFYIKDIIDELKHNPKVNLITGPLIYFKLIQTKVNEYYLLTQAHHFIFDGVSLFACLNRISNNYNKFYHLEEFKNDECKKSLIKYLEFQNRISLNNSNYDWGWYGKEVAKCCESPFQTMLTEDETLEEVFKFISSEKIIILKKMLKKHAATINIFYSLVLAIIFFKITGNRKNVIEIPVNIRKYVQPEFYGNYLYPFPLVVEVNEKLSFTENLNQLKLTVKDFKKHFKHINSIYENEHIISYFKNNDARILVNQSARNIPVIKLSGALGELISCESISSVIDIQIDYEENKSGMNLFMSYKRKKFCRKQMNFLFEQIINICDNLIKNNNLSIDNYNWGHNILNGKKAFLNKNYFTESALKNFEINKKKLAYKSQTKSFTYEEIGKKMRKYVDFFSTLYDSTSRPVFSLYIENNFIIYIITLSLLSAKLPFLLINKKEPLSRLEFYLENSDSYFLLSDIISNASLSKKWKSVNINELHDISFYIKDFKPEKKYLIDDDIAYITYTSGSTGYPKGIKISYDSLYNVINFFLKKFKFKVNSRYLILSSPGFDIFILEILLPFFGTGTLLDPTENIDSFTNLGNFIDKYKPHFIQSTPSHWIHLYSKIRLHKDFVLLTGGEPIDKTLKNKLLSITKKVYNVYGPSETTIWSTCNRLKKNELPEISTPIFNTQLLVLNKNNEPVPLGFSGELFVAGAGVSKGYLDLALNSSKFIRLDNDLKEGDGSIYGFKTGDIVRLDFQEKIYYQDREDSVIKLNGIRIDLNGIKSALLRLNIISNAQVVLRKGKNHLTAFIIPNIIISSEKFNTLVYQKLSNILPPYLIPSEFVFVDNFPMTITQKIDTKALTSLSYDESNDFYKNNCEILKIIECILEKKNIQTTLSFFEQGGTSIKAILLSEKILDHFSIKLNISEIFESSSVSSLVNIIKLKLEKKSEDYNKINIQPRDRLEISFLAFIEYTLGKINNVCINKNIIKSNEDVIQILFFANKYFNLNLIPRVIEFTNLKSISALANYFRDKILHHFNPVVYFRISKSSQDFMVFIHGLGGNIWRYFELSRSITRDINIIGLECPGLSSRETPCNDMNKIVKLYSQAIKELKPRRVTLIGWCMGGLIADELACDLLKFNISVTAVYINISPPHVLFDKNREFSSNYSKIINLMQEEFSKNIKDYNYDLSSRKNKLTSLTSMALLIKNIYQNGSYFKDKNFGFYFENGYFYRMLKVHYFNSKMLAESKKITFASQVKKYLFLTKDCFTNLGVKDDVLMDFFSKNDNINNIIRLPGNHFTALNGKSSQIIANFLNKL